MNYGGGSYGIQGGGGNAFPSWGMPPPMMPMPYGMPYPMFSMPDASGMPMPSPYAGMYGGPSPGAMPPMHWDAMYAPYLSPNGRADASGGGSGRGRGSGRPDRKSQRSRFSRSIYQPDPNAERPEDSKPCRTLFVRNVAFEVNVNALRAEFASFGEVRTWFDLIQRRGMLFVSYYDTRAAERARVTMNQKVYVGRTLDVHFSLPKDEDQEQHCDRDKNQGTLFVDVKDALEPITDEAFRAHFEQFGEIRAIRTYKDQSHTRFVEYWDSRACVKAHDTCQDSKFAGGTMQVKFAWDLSTVSLVNDARTRSEAKAAAEARARQNQQGVPVPGELASLPQATSDATPEPPSETHTSSLAAAKQLEDSSASATETDSQSPMASSHLTWCTNEPSGAAPEARLEQAQRVQQVCAFKKIIF